MLARLAEGAFWVGLVLLALAVVQGLGARFGWTVISAQWSWLWWPFVIVGLALVLLSFLPFWRDPKATLSTRGVRYGANTLAAVILVLGVIGVVEALSYRHNSRIDLTENRRHSLSPQTIQTLQGLKVKVSAVAFYRSDQPGKRVIEDLFKQYARYGARSSPGGSSTPIAIPRWPARSASRTTAPPCSRPRGAPRRCRTPTRRRSSPTAS